MDEKEASGENRRRIGNRLKKNFFVLQDSLNLTPGEPEGNVKPKRLPNDTIIRKKTKKELPVVVEVDDDHIYDQKTKDKHDLIRNSSDAKQQNKNVDDTPKAEQREEGVGVYMTKNTLALQDSRIHTNDIKNEVYSGDLYDCGIEKNTTETKLDEVCDTIEPIEIIPTSHYNGEVSFKNPTNLAPHGPGIDSFSNNTRRTLVSDENLDALSNSQNGIPEQLNRRLGSKVSSPKLSKIASQDEFKRVLRSKQSTDSMVKLRSPGSLQVMSKSQVLLQSQSPLSPLSTIPNTSTILEADKLNKRFETNAQVNFKRISRIYNLIGEKEKKDILKLLRRSLESITITKHNNVSLINMESTSQNRDYKSYKSHKSHKYRIRLGSYGELGYSKNVLALADNGSTRYLKELDSESESPSNPFADDITYFKDISSIDYAGLLKQTNVLGKTSSRYISTGRPPLKINMMYNPPTPEIKSTQGRFARSLSGGSNFSRTYGRSIISVASDTDTLLSPRKDLLTFEEEFSIYNNSESGHQVMLDQNSSSLLIKSDFTNKYKRHIQNSYKERPHRRNDASFAKASKVEISQSSSKSNPYRRSPSLSPVDPIRARLQKFKK